MHVAILDVDTMSDDDELSWKEKNRLYGISMIPSLIVAFASAIYFLFYLKKHNFTESILDIFIYVGLPIFLIGLPLSSLAIEVLCHRKIKQPLILHMKRFSGRVLLILTSFISFYILVLMVNTGLSTIIGEEGAFIIGFLAFIFGFYMVLSKFRGFFSRLDRGEW